MNWSNNGERMQVHAFGSITFTDDLTDVQSLSDGGSLTIRDWTTVVPHTIEIASERGKLTRSYWVAGMSRPWGAEAQRRLAEILPPLVRNSGAFAESRVKSILAKKGVAGVLDEIGLVTSDYPRRVYYVALLDNVALDGASLATVLQQVGQRIKSDYDRRTVLEHVAARTQLDDRTALAYARAIEGMTSSYDKRQALVALIARDPLPAAAKQSVLTSAASVRSDYDRREILVAYLRKHGVDPAVREPFFAAVSGISSDYDRRQVLTDVAHVRALSAEVKTSALQSVGSMRSDYDRAETLLAFLRQQGVDAATRQPFLDAANRIRSTHDQNRVLAELVKAERR